jgi:gliding motility-associated-like protein
MKSILPILALLVLTSLQISATHNRAGEITYRQISNYTFEFTITTFTFTYSPIEQNIEVSTHDPSKSGLGRQELEILFGDNTTGWAQKATRDTLKEDNTYIKSTFLITHTFPGPGIYSITMQDNFRNVGVKNIKNAESVYFSVTTTILINPQIGKNNTPVLLNYPIDKATYRQKFIHNPAAYDPDGDSLSYSITTCTKEKGQPIDNYNFPPTTDSLYIDKVTGDLIWDAPNDTGKFNIAINIEEWRKGIKIGNIVRDMQIEVFKTDNEPPVNRPLPNICVEAGKFIRVPIVSTDTNKNLVTISASGGPFVVTTSPAQFSQLETLPGWSRGEFIWQTNYNHVRKQPYFVVVKSEDNFNPVKLFDIDNFSISVLAPAPKNLKALAFTNSIRLTWDRSVCPGASGYEIYRTTQKLPFVIDSCNGGIPENAGYTRVAIINNPDSLSFIDGNQGSSLSLGYDYCYRVIAIFPDGAKSYPSDPACAILLPGLPALTNASVTKIGTNDGKIFLSWIKPQIPDTIQTSGPYLYRILRTDNFAGNNFTEIHTRVSADLTDTTYTDTLLNTIQFPYNYKVELYNNEPGNQYLIGSPETASSFYPVASPDDNQLTLTFMKKVPWLNYKYVIYRQNLQTLDFDSIGETFTEAYIDKELANGQEYSYRVKAYGERLFNGLAYSVINWSHIHKGTPKDTVPPCSPLLTAVTSCDSFANIITSINLKNNNCSNDIIRFNIYYRRNIQSDYQLVYSLNHIPSVTDSFTFVHKPEETLVGCYIVTAVDSFNNETPVITDNEVCVEDCEGYELPNVFTPNGDLKNDIMIATNKNNYIKRVDMKIYNRWGNLVFKTEDPYINWDGKDMTSKQFVSSGIYYYVCDIYKPAITGTAIKTLTGFVYVYYNKKEKPSLE